MKLYRAVLEIKDHGDAHSDMIADALRFATTNYGLNATSATVIELTEVREKREHQWDGVNAEIISGLVWAQHCLNCGVTAIDATPECAGRRQ